MATACSSCGKELLSALSVAGTCEECDKPLCLECWRIHKVRLCKEHAGAVVGGEAGKAEAGKPISVNPIHKQLEDSFISRFEVRLGGLKEIEDPLRKHKFAFESHSSSDHQRDIELEVRSRGFPPELAVNLPLSKSSQFTFKRSAFFPPVKHPAALVVEARVLSRIAALLDAGDDTEPSSLSDLQRFLAEILPQKSVEGARILGIASQTGWAEDCIEYLNSQRDFESRNLSLCLVDLKTGERYFNPADVRMAALADLFSTKLHPEQVDRCIAHIRDELLLVNSLSLESVADNLEVKTDVVRDAFLRMEKEGRYIVDDIKGLGLVISRKLRM